MSSTLSIIAASVARSSGRHGANVTPQLPITTLVTPCQQLDVPIGSHAIWASRCVWMSTKPGVTRRPSASISRRPVWSTPPSSASTIAVITSPVIATSATPARCTGAIHDGAVPDDDVRSHVPPLNDSRRTTTQCLARQHVSDEVRSMTFVLRCARARRGPSGGFGSRSTPRRRSARNRTAGTPAGTPHCRVPPAPTPGRPIGHESAAPRR